MSDPDPHARVARQPSLAVVVREWGRIGCMGFGGPPTHIKLLRELCVERKRWLTPVKFEDAVAACNLLPGPASTQLAISCAWRVRGRRGALLGGAAFIAPGLILILALSALFLAGAPPRAVLAAGAGAGSAVAAVAVHAAADLLPGSWHRARDGGRASRLRWASYVAAGLLAAATIGPWLVLVLLACGAIETTSRRRRDTTGPTAIAPMPLLAIGTLTGGGAAP
jgi:chromate transporter